MEYTGEGQDLGMEAFLFIMWPTCRPSFIDPSHLIRVCLHAGKQSMQRELEELHLHLDIG